MIFKNFTCTSADPHGYMDKLSCFMSKSSKRGTFSLEMLLKKDVKKFLLDLRVELPRKGGDNFVLLNITHIDGCNWMSNKNQIPFIKIGRTLLDRFSNFPSQCPFQNGTSYYIRGFRVDMKLFPAFSFEADMLIWFDFIVEQSKVISGFIHSSVKRNKNRGFKGL